MRSNKRLKTFHSAENQKNDDKEDHLNDEYQIFNTLWGTYKPGKKHKIWEEDGILTRKGRLISLYKVDGTL